MEWFNWMFFFGWMSSWVWNMYALPAIMKKLEKRNGTCWECPTCNFSVRGNNPDFIVLSKNTHLGQPCSQKVEK